jgi:hypothetical protein
MFVYVIYITEVHNFGDTNHGQNNMQDEFKNSVKSSFVAQTKTRNKSSQQEQLSDRKQVINIPNDVSLSKEQLEDQEDPLVQQNLDGRNNVDADSDAGDAESVDKEAKKNDSTTMQEVYMRRHKPREGARKRFKERQKHREENPINFTEIDMSKYTYEETAIQPNITNMEYYNIPSTNGNLWDDDSEIPYWMRSYFNWHKWKRRTWNLTNWQSERWMIMQCLIDQDRKKCGGVRYEWNFLLLCLCQLMMNKEFLY